MIVISEEPYPLYYSQPLYNMNQPTTINRTSDDDRGENLKNKIKEKARSLYYDAKMGLKNPETVGKILAAGLAAKYLI